MAAMTVHENNLRVVFETIESMAGTGVARALRAIVIDLEGNGLVGEMLYTLDDAHFDMMIERLNEFRRTGRYESFFQFMSRPVDASEKNEMGRVFRIGADGEEYLIEMKDLRKGHVFYTVDGESAGPLLLAEEDAGLRSHPKNPSKVVWGCKAKFVTPKQEVRFSEKI
jgi:hypothetical protein